MKELIERIRARLAQGAYPSEASISHGIVTPVLAALGWDTSDPEQLLPEYSIPQRGRVDFALLGLGKRPAVFIEVKALGLALNGDRQLFEYAFHHGVPLCVLTDGREWSFYLPSGQGSYDDRRVYRLQLDDRDSEACERILWRYLSRDRVRHGSAHEDAQRDHRDAAGQREAEAALAPAWRELTAAPEELLVDLLGAKAEMLSGYWPGPSTVARFLQQLQSRPSAGPLAASAPVTLTAGATPTEPQYMVDETVADAATAQHRAVRFTIFGEERSCGTASEALVDVLRTLAARDPSRIEQLAEAVRGRSRNLIARSVQEINPARPDLARAQPFAPGWLVGLNVSNQDKMAIIRAACAAFSVTMPGDLTITLPNAV